MLRTHERRDDREVIGDLGVVEDTAIRLHPFPLQDLARKSAIGVAVSERFHRRIDRLQIIFGQCARVGARIRERLVLFVERLRK